MKEYTVILQKYGTDIKRVTKDNIDKDKDLKLFFHPFQFNSHQIPNYQSLDFDGFLGRVLSSSYIPLKGHPNHKPLLSALNKLFDHHQKDDKIQLTYTTEIYWGELK